MPELFKLATLDTSPLRHRDFRLLFWGQLVSFLGSQITYVAVPYQVYELTHSPLVVGLLGIAELVPVLALSMLGGAIAGRSRPARGHPGYRSHFHASLGAAARQCAAARAAVVGHLWPRWSPSGAVRAAAAVDGGSGTPARRTL